MHHHGRFLRTAILSLVGCVALIGAAAPGLAQSGPARPMHFWLDENDADYVHWELITNGDRPIYAAGKITAGTAERLIAFAQANGIRRGRVFFDSPGGDVIAAIELGEAIRKLGFNTEVGGRAASTCASACVYAYAGGRARFLMSDNVLGVHQFRGIEASSDSQLLSGVIVEYLSRMEIDPGAFTLAATTDARSIRWLTLEEAEGLGLVDNGVKPTEVQIKMANGIPMLELIQYHYSGIVFAHLACTEGGVLMNAGIVASAGDVEEHMAGLTSAYFELDRDPVLFELGADAAQRFNELGVTLLRDVPADIAARMVSADELAIWIQNGSPWRWGNSIDLRPARGRLAAFLAQCHR